MESWDEPGETMPLRAAALPQALLCHLDEAEKAVAERLKSVDWDFRIRVVRHEVEGVHPYPAKFIADLPSALLDALSLPKGSIVLDPFCGSGTTLAEAQRRSLLAIGIDLNPIACMIARVKTRPLPKRVEESVRAVLDKLRTPTSPKPPQIPNLNHWFEQPVQVALAKLTAAIRACPVDHRDFLELAASSIIVRVSNQESDTRYAAVSKNVQEADVLVAFQRACEKLIEALEARSATAPVVKVLQGDLMTLNLREYTRKVSAIITSPPYPNAYEYWLYHKYRMWWLGHDPLHVKEREIGARAHFFGGRRDTAATFGEQMATCMRSLAETLVPGGWICFIMGRSIIHGEEVDNASTLELAGYKLGLHKVFSAKRNVLSTRKSFNLSHAKINQETILVMRKPLV